MGLTRIFACAAAAALIPALVLFALSKLEVAVDADAQHACGTAQELVAESLTDGRVVGFLPCQASKELKLGKGRWQIMGDVEIETATGEHRNEAFLARLALAPDGSGRLESLSLR